LSRPPMGLLSTSSRPTQASLFESPDPSPD
jgi:hypothetical protein